MCLVDSLRSIAYVSESRPGARRLLKFSSSGWCNRPLPKQLGALARGRVGEFVLEAESKCLVAKYEAGVSGWRSERTVLDIHHFQGAKVPIGAGNRRICNDAMCLAMASRARSRLRRLCSNPTIAKTRSHGISVAR